MLTLFYKISNGLAPSYLADQVPERSEISINLRSRQFILAPPRTESYNNSFFPYCISHWNELDDSITNSPSISSFKKNLIKFIRPPPRTFYDISDRFGIKLLTKIRVGFPIFELIDLIIILIVKVLLAFATVAKRRLSILSYDVLVTTSTG